MLARKRGQHHPFQRGASGKLFLVGIRRKEKNLTSANQGLSSTLHEGRAAGKVAILLRKKMRGVSIAR